MLLIALLDMPFVWSLVDCVAWALLDSMELSGEEFAELVSEFFGDEDIEQLQKDLIDIPLCEESSD